MKMIGDNMRKPVRILFIVRGEGDEVASSRYRVYQYLPALDESGIDYRVVSPPRRKIAHGHLWLPWLIRVLLYGLQSTTILVQKDIFSLSLWKLFKRAGKKVVYDYDDAVFIEAPGLATTVFSFPPQQRTCAELAADMVQLSDLTIVANNYLASFARPFTKNVRIIPMSLDLREYPVKCHNNVAPLVIGWIGSPQTVEYLSLIEGALEQIASRYGNEIEIRIITNGEIPLQAVRHKKLPWEASREIAEILSFDIGIVPLPETPFTLGKSSFKLLQFMACGLPVVCSAVGFNQEVVQNGRNGFIAQDTNAWVQQLSKLITDAKVRRELGNAARKTAEDCFSLKANAAIFQDAIMDL